MIRLLTKSNKYEIPNYITYNSHRNPIFKILFSPFKTYKIT